MKIAILGDGGLARELSALLRRWLPRCGVELHGPSTEAEGWKSPWVIGVGNPQLRKDIAWGAYANSPHRPLDVAWRDYGRSSITIGNGRVVMPGVRGTTGIHLGSHVLLNLNVTVGHDTRIGRYSVINPGANISGHVTIGECVLVGAGACIREGVTIGDGATVGMGAAVLKDVPAGEVWVGNPARRLR